MTTDLSPVTENEMRNFFDRVATSFVSMSQQAADLVRLQDEVELSSRKLNELIAKQAEAQEEIEGLRRSNAYLSRSAAENGELARVYSSERDEARKQVQELAGQVQRADNLVTSHATRIQELEARVAELQADNKGLQQNLDWARRDAQEAQSSLDRAESEAKRYKDKFAAFKSLFEDDKVPASPVPTHDWHA